MPLQERVARFLCAKYWAGDEDRWDEWVEIADQVIQWVQEGEVTTP